MDFFNRFLPSPELLRSHNIRWLVLSRFFANLFFYSTTIVLFQEQRGLNFTQMFLMESILSATIWLTELPSSVLADRFHYHRLIVVGRAVGVVGMVVYFFAHGFWLFALAEVLGGVAFACVSGCESALAYNSLTPHQRREQGSAAFALLGAATSAGFFLGLFSGSFLGAYSPALAVGVSILPAALSLLAALRLRGASGGGVTASSETGAGAVSLRAILRTALGTVRAQPRLALLSVFNSLAFAQANAIFWYNQPYFTRAGIPVAWFGPLMAAAVALQFGLVLRVPALQQWLGSRRAPGTRHEPGVQQEPGMRHGPGVQQEPGTQQGPDSWRLLGTRRLLALACLLPGLAYALLALARSPVAVALLVTGVVAFSALREPLVEDELNRRIPDAARATTLSALSLTGALAKALLDPAIGFLGDQGLLVTGLGLGVGLAVLGLLAVRVVPEG